MAIGGEFQGQLTPSPQVLEQKTGTKPGLGPQGSKTQLCTGTGEGSGKF